MDVNNITDRSAVICCYMLQSYTDSWGHESVTLNTHFPSHKHKVSILQLVVIKVVGVKCFCERVEGAKFVLQIK